MTRNTKIAIVHPMDPEGKKVGGIESLIKGFIKHAPSDFEIELVGVSTDPSKRPPGKRVDLKIGSKIFKFFPLMHEKSENVKSKIPLSFRFMLALKSVSYDFSEQLIFLHSIEPASHFKKNRAPVFLVTHNDLKEQIRGQKGEVLWRRIPYIYFWYERSVMNFIDQIYTESMSTLSYYQSKYPALKDKFQFLPTWFDSEVFYLGTQGKSVLKERLASTSRLPRDAKWIIFTGRLQAQKAPERLIESFFEYQRSNAESILILIGEGNLRGSAEALAAKHGISKKVHFLGNLNQTQIADYYRASDVFLMTSFYEGMSVSVLEALACGLPVVSTDVGENRLVVRSSLSGEIVSKYSARTMAEALEKVLTSPAHYQAFNCENIVSSYAPVKVLEPVYASMRQSYQARFSK